ncbi:hypothetical protein PA25_19180 [Pseudoalteromonas sp. A25]|uniref:hypothetical protein n=1 Tax=Pseudoalteromonas sp. A25 TaxID=116092 RepID=UPI00126085E2|nr:hypothetical protein [Pseudoalteromonas sp. A25]BBN81933.1 hypothetical protein PA25_19180 [Pseudoalteromonas sp. A25]
MFNWSDTKQAIYLHGTYLLTHPETGERWESKQQAQLWYMEYQAQEQAREEELEQRTTPELKAVTLQAIDGALKVPSNFESLDAIKVTVAEGQNVTLTGLLDIADESFLVPVLRDDGRRVYFPIEVQNGQFSATFNFPTSGRFEVSQALLNEEFAQPRFRATSITFYVIRQAQTAA